MTLSHGRPYLAIPGPSVMPDRVLNAMHRPAPNIYSGPLVDMVAGMIPDLKAVAGTAHQATIYIANGHGTWEAALANVLSRGDRILVLATGRFAHGWGEMATGLGAKVDVLDFGNRGPIDMAQVEKALLADTGHDYHAVMTVHVDTATSVRNDIPALRAVLDRTGHPALLMIDCIASLGCDRFEMDNWGVDVMVAGSQKGLMTPPGLGFVFFNEKADRARDDADCVTSYWDWRKRANPAHFYEYFNGTAPTHHLYGLREALDMIAEEGGMDAVWARHEKLARAIGAAFEVWGGEGPLDLNVTDPACRSHAVTAVRIGAPYGTQLRDWVEEKAGVTLGIGLGMADPDDPAWHGFFRVGHMGHVNAHMVMGVLGVIEAGLIALNIPHGAGALAAAARVIAEA